MRFGSLSRLAFVVVAASMGVASAGPLGTVISNYNFDSQNIGDPAADGVSTGGFPDSPPYTGTVTVQNVGTMTKAAQMITTQGGTGAQYVDTSFDT